VKTFHILHLLLGRIRDKVFLKTDSTSLTLVFLLEWNWSNSRDIKTMMLQKLRVSLKKFNKVSNQIISIKEIWDKYIILLSLIIYFLNKMSYCPKSFQWRITKLLKVYQMWHFIKPCKKKKYCILACPGWLLVQQA
jgi:hypothetical protein